MLGSQRFVIRSQHPECIHVFIEGSNVAIGDGPIVGSFLVGSPNDLVVDVGKVADKGDIVTVITEVAVDDVEDDGGTCMTDMAVVVNSYAADVKPHLAGFQRDEWLLGPGQGIVKL